MKIEQRAPAAKRKTGRPRRLTLESIVETACGIGLASLELGLVAKRLNVAATTLYGYVESRERLFQLVGERLAAQARIKDRGQNWQELVREHAALTSALFQSQPEMISDLIGGVDSLPRDFGYSEAVLTILVDRGFTSSEAIDFYIEINQVIIGASILSNQRKGYRTLLQRHEPGKSALPAIFGDFRATLERMIASEEVRRRHT